MSRRLALLACPISRLIGTAGIISPTAASAAAGWTMLSRHCFTIQDDGNRLRACTSIKGGLVGDQFMIRTRCRVKALNFEPFYLWIESCDLLNVPGYEVLASTQMTSREDVTSVILKSPLVRCDPTIGYEGITVFRFSPSPPGEFALLVDWPISPNTADCSPPT